MSSICFWYVVEYVIEYKIVEKKYLKTALQRYCL